MRQPGYAWCTAIVVLIIATMPFHLSKVFQSHSKEQVDGHVMVGYFPNWAIYQRNYKPCDVPVEKLTHILYAFANIDPDNGSVFLTDLWSDQQIKYDQQGEEQDHLYGNFLQFLQYKKQHRHLKLLLSIGGWSYSSNFRCLDDPAKRSQFAKSAVQLLADNGLDGLDVDWEYPETKQQSQIYTQLLRELRSRLDVYHSEFAPNESRYLLTVAAPAAPQKYQVLDIKEMDSFLDFWNLMTYDFSGSWDSNANSQANLYGSPLSVQRSVEYYASHGTKASKLVVGIPLYGRGFNGTKGLGDRYSQVAPGSLEAGVYSYRELPLNNATEHFDERSGAGFSYDPSLGQLISYDTVESARAKADYIQKKRLLGAMFWELSGDRPCSDPRSLINVFAGKLAPLDTQPNHLHYPKSKFVNVRSSP